MKQDLIIKKYIADKFAAKKEGNVIVFAVPIEQITEVCKQYYFEHKLQLKTITAADERNDDAGFKIFYVFGVPNENIFLAPCIVLKDQNEFPSITKDIHEASGYERKINTFFRK